MLPLPRQYLRLPSLRAEAEVLSAHAIAQGIAQRSRGRPRCRPRLGKNRRYRQSRKRRKKVEILFAHLKRVLKLDRLRLRGRSGARDEFLLAAIAQNLRRLAIRALAAMNQSNMAFA